MRQSGACCAASHAFRSTCGLWQVARDLMNIPCLFLVDSRNQGESIGVAIPGGMRMRSSPWHRMHAAKVACRRSGRMVIYALPINQGQ